MKPEEINVAKQKCQTCSDTGRIGNAGCGNCQTAVEFESWQSGLIHRAVKNGLEIQHVVFDWPSLRFYFDNLYTPKQAWREAFGIHITIGKWVETKGGGE